MATARRFSAAGWRVASLDKQFGADVIGERVDFDLTRIAEIPALIASVGEVDTLVNNAGVLHCDPIEAIPDVHRAETLALNLLAPATLIGRRNKIRSRASITDRRPVVFRAEWPLSVISVAAALSVSGPLIPYLPTSLAVQRTSRRAKNRRCPDYSTRKTSNVLALVAMEPEATAQMRFIQLYFSELVSKYGAARK